MVLVRGGAGRVGDGSCGTSWAVTHSGGNAWRSASSICWPRGASVSVAAARGWTARRDPRGAFVVPAPVVFVFGARRRCGTAAIRAPSIDADSIVADIIARAGVVTRCVLTRRALRCVGRAATFRLSGYQKAPSHQKCRSLRVSIFSLKKGPKNQRTLQNTCDRRLVAPTRVKVLPEPQSQRDTPISLIDCTQIRQSQFLTPQMQKIRNFCQRTSQDFFWRLPPS